MGPVEAEGVCVCVCVCACVCVGGPLFNTIKSSCAWSWDKFNRQFKKQSSHGKKQVESLPTGKSWHRAIAHVKTFKSHVCTHVCVCGCVCAKPRVCVIMCACVSGLEGTGLLIRRRKTVFSHIALMCATSQVLRIHANALVVVATCINVPNQSNGINIQLGSKGPKARLWRRWKTQWTDVTDCNTPLKSTKTHPMCLKIQLSATLLLLHVKSFPMLLIVCWCDVLLCSWSCSEKQNFPETVHKKAHVMEHF